MQTQITQQHQLVIVDKEINEDFNFKIESANQTISENQIYNHQTKSFLKNYEVDDNWDAKSGAFGFVEKFILKSNIKESQNMPREVISKTVLVKNEGEKFEIEREIQAYINLGKIKDISQNLVSYYGWKLENKFT